MRPEIVGYREKMAMRTRSGLLVLACQLIFSLYASGAADDDSWHNLSRVTRERYYTVVDRKLNCFTGHILAVTDRAITLKYPDASTITLVRNNVLRVSVSQAARFASHLRADVDRVDNVIYNDKSSWVDIKRIAPHENVRDVGETARVVKKDGQQYQGQLVRVSETELELERPAGRLTIAKADIAQVYYLRYKPLTDSEKYSAQEDFWLDPRLWPYYLHLSVKIPVRLYDSSLPEEDTPLKCEYDPKEKASPRLDCFSGNVQSIDLPKVTILRSANRTQTLQWTEGTSIREGAHPTSIDQLEIGDYIIACGSVENGTLVTKRVTVNK